MKPRVASYYEHRLGRNDGNPLYVSHVFRRDYADRVDYTHLIPDASAFHDVYTGYDLHLWVDWAEDALYANQLLPYPPMRCPTPNVYWASDTHLGWAYRRQKAEEFGVVCVAQRDDAARMATELPDRRVVWLPHAVDPDVYNPAGTYTRTASGRAQAAAHRAIPTWDVAFVGFLTFPQRIDFLDAVFKGVQAQGRTAWYAIRFFEQAAAIYTRAKIVLNHAVQGDVNMRVFEALATRSFLLTPDVPGLRDLFEDGVHLVTYRDGDAADCLEKIAEWGPRDDDRARIAEAGYREVLAHHTFTHRVGRMLELGGLVV